MPDEPACRFLVPMPPSTNHLRGIHIDKTTGKPMQHKTGTYKAWIKAAGWNMRAQGIQPLGIAGPVRMLIEGVKGIDLDNIKAIPDLCKTMHLIVDDNQVKDLRVTEAGGSSGMVIVSLWTI